MNITEETNEYFSTTGNWKQFVKEYNFEKNYNPLEHCNANSGLKERYIAYIDPCKEETEFIKQVNKQIEEADWSAFGNKKRGITINWSKIFKRGWLLWK